MEVISGENSFCVRSEHHQSFIVKALETFFAAETYSDCSLAAEGQEIAAHKIVLSACSPFLNNLLRKHRDKHPVVVLNDVSYQDVNSVVEYMYRGEVEVEQRRIRSFLKTAEVLGVTELATKKRTISESSTASETISKWVKIDDEEEEVDDEIEYLTDEVDTENDTFQLLVVEETGGIKTIDGRSYYNEITESAKDVKTNVLPTDYTEPEVENLTTLAPSAFTAGLNRFRAAKSEEYNLRCNQCGGIYKDSSSYTKHLRYDCNKIHKCEACKKKFKNKRHLLDHVRDDCGRVHVCPKCDRTFKQKVNLTTHQKHYCKPERC